MPKISKQLNHEQSTYLKKLKFDPRLKDSLIAKYLRSTRLVILIVLTIIILGVYSYINLPRNINPEIKIPLIIITTVIPGAGPSDVESLVTIPLEDSIRSIQKIKTIQSVSRDSVSVITAEFNSGVDPEKARENVKSAVDAALDLPQDAQTPKVQKLDFENQPIWSFEIVGKGDDASLIRFARELEKNLEDLPSVDKVFISGLEEQEIQILIKSEIISSYSINPQLLISAIKNSLKSLPAGSLKTADSNFAFTIDPAIISVDNLRSIRVNLSENIANLSDIAIVSERSKPNQAPSYIATNNSEPFRAVSFDIFRVSTSRIDKTVQESKLVVKNKIENSQFKIYSVSNVGEILDEQFKDLQRDFSLTVILVAIILFIFLGFRQAAVAGTAIPLTFLITFTVMSITGIALSFISTFSLLLSLGLLVDDTIVVISAMTAYQRTGKFTPFQTGLLVWKDFLTPVLTTTVTTVWAFLPLLIATGIIGEFIKPIPIVVSSTLIASIFVALFITLPFIIFLLKPDMPLRVVIFLRILGIIVLIISFYLLIPRNTIFLLQLLAFAIFLFITFRIRSLLAKRLFVVFRNNNFLKIIKTKFIDFQKLSREYKILIRSILLSKKARRQTIIMVIIFSLFSYLLFPLGFVKNEFFPKTDQDFLYINVEYPAGTNLEKTNAEAIKLLNNLKNTKDVNFVIANIAKTSSDFDLSSQGDTNQVQFILVLKDKNERKRDSLTIAEELRNKFGNYQKGKLSVQEISGGPPAGADLQIKLFGEDLAKLDFYANKLRMFLSKQPGVTNIDKSIKTGTSKLVFVPDKQKLAQNNLTLDQIGFWFRLFTSGLTADTIKLPENSNLKKDISIRLGSQMQKVEDVTALNIPLQNGEVLPVSYLGEIKLEANPTLITRESGKRTLSVTASVTKGFSISTINRNLEKYANLLNLPDGYSWQTGGLNEENQKSVTSILQAMLLSFLLIIITMVVQFSSFRKAFIVMLVIPLSISGVFVVFALTQTPLSFPALIGVLALFGIVVKNSILLVDKIIANEKSGMEFIESISDAASLRLEAIALTSIATISGLIPITFSNPLWRGLGGAIIAGLVFSGTIMLFFIPVVYYLIFRSAATRRDRNDLN